MATMRQIRSRIRVAKNIQQITKAMKMVAAARLKRAQDRVQAARPYSQKMRDVMASLSRAATVDHPLLAVREPNRIGVLAVTADRGLCGSYATNILRRTMEVLRPHDPQSIRLLVVGRKGHTFFRRRPYPVAGEFGANMTGVSFGEAQAIARQARELFASGEIDVLYLVYSRFLSALVQRPTVIQLLPISVDEAEGAATSAVAPAESGGGGEVTDDYLFEPSAESILERLLPRYVDTQIYQALIEAVASEHGSRMTAMSSATDNAGKMISGLTLSLNRARQAIITKEIAEIVGGAEALK
jgi:F-type H+-transporting ATPase subunit gamma